MLRKLAFVFLVLIGTNVMAADAPNGGMSERQKIDYLLNSLETSHVTFIRNGVPMSSTDASKHLRDKLTTWKDPVNTAQDFITKIASNSSHSGKPYTIRMKDGTEEPSAKWFQDKLAAREGGNTKQ